MEASLMPYCQGAIVLFEPPVCTEDEQKRYRIYPKHPVMIATKNFSETCSDYMCFPITSKLEKYCGYRIMLNTSLDEEGAGKMSVIRTDVMERIERRYLRTCFGYAPPELVRKCLQAYAWHIGLSDLIPEYVRKDKMRYEFFNAGESNDVHLPVRIAGDIACHSGFDSATGMPRAFGARDFVVKPAPTRIPAPIIGGAKQPEGVPATPPTEQKDETKGPKYPKTGRTLTLPPEKTIREEIDSTKMPEFLDANSTATNVQRSIRRGRIAAKNADIDLDKLLVEQVKSLSIDDRFAIYCGVMTEVAMRKKFDMSKYMAHKVRLGVMQYITEHIEKVATDMRKFSKDCKYFISDEDVLVLRCMMPHELHYARVGSDFYMYTVCEKYEFNYHKDTITGMIADELKRRGKKMGTF